MVARDKLRSFIERVERLDEEIKGLNSDKRDIYAEAKGQGFDAKALKIIVTRRRVDPEKLNELDSIVDTYLAALEGGTPVATRVHVREPEPKATTEVTVATSVPPASVLSHNSQLPDLPEFLDRRKAAPTADDAQAA